MINAVIVKTTGEIESLEYTGNYTQIAQVVGGYIEAVNFGDKPYFCYVNEEGKFNNLEENKLATNLWYNSGQIVLLGDYLAGDVIFFGQVDEDGNDTDCPDSLLEDLVKSK